MLLSRPRENSSRICQKSEYLICTFYSTLVLHLAYLNNMVLWIQCRTTDCCKVQIATVNHTLHIDLVQRATYPARPNFKSAAGIGRARQKIIFDILSGGLTRSMRKQRKPNFVSASACVMGMKCRERDHLRPKNILCQKLIFQNEYNYILISSVYWYFTIWKLVLCFWVCPLKYSENLGPSSGSPPFFIHRLNTFAWLVLGILKCRVVRDTDTDQAELWIREVKRGTFPGGAICCRPPSYLSGLGWFA